MTVPTAASTTVDNTLSQMMLALFNRTSPLSLLVPRDVLEFVGMGAMVVMVVRASCVIVLSNIVVGFRS